jgi:aminoglycoside phosphotransferase family enzyme/predicted kinase
MTGQDAVVEALANPGFYPEAPETVEHVQTHISHVFLAGAFVYKLKKAVRLPFLDFSTVASRRVFCDEEVRLNRRLSPAVYLGVRRITRASNGTLVLDGDGETVDYVVWMRRLPARRTLAALIDAGQVRPEMLGQLATLLAHFHAAAPTGPAIATYATPAALETTWNRTLDLATPFVGGIVAPQLHGILTELGHEFVRRHEALFHERERNARIREGHGDLHAEHVYFVDAPVPAPPLAPLPAGMYVVDCLEFSLPLRCNDVASEIAFTAMDLERRGRDDLARDFVRRYVAATHDGGIERLLPFYTCYRACVRGAVEALKNAETEVPPIEREAARHRSGAYFDLAFRCAWSTEGPALIACAGLSGTGKSTVAAAIADATGYGLLSSDVLRKRGIVGTTPASYGEGMYASAARTAVYRTLCREAERLLRDGRGVVADATFLRLADRASLAGVAAACGRPHVFVECRAPEDVVRGRLLARRGSLSDARWETYVRQRATNDPLGSDEPHLVVDTAGSLDTGLWNILERLWAWYQSSSQPIPVTGNHEAHVSQI